MALRLQEWIHRFEEGAGSLIVRALLAVMVMLGAGVFFNLTQYQNLASAEGMDQAQLARNLAVGRGFQTHLIRPLSLHLVFHQATNELARGELSTGSPADAVADPTAPAAAPPDQDLTATTTATPEEDYWLTLLKDRHPDLANAPLYPLVLAAVLKLNPFGFPSLIGDAQTEIFGPDRWIALFNQLLFLVAVWMTFRLARGWFDTQVALLSAGVMLLSLPLWRWTLSGQSIMLQMVLVLALLDLVGSLERRSRDEGAGAKGLMKGALLAGLLLGLLGLTRYSMLLLLVPACIMLGTLPSPRRTRLVGVCVLVCLVVVGPWILRNYHLSGTPFGTAGFHLFQDTASFPDDSLVRSVNPDFREFYVSELKSKLFRNLPRFLLWELPRLGGSWMSAFFLAGLLVPFRNPMLTRLRHFLVLTLLTGVMVRALASPAIPADEAASYADPVLVTFVPLVFIFGASLFITLFQQLAARVPGVRYDVLGGFCLLFSLPLLLGFIQPVRTNLAFPPYYPRWIQEKAAFLGEADWSLSDIPWAMAWYGDRPSVQWPSAYKSPGTGRYHNDFFEIHHRFKPINALYLSTKAMGRVETESLIAWISRTDEGSWEETLVDWESFILVGILLKNEVPQEFPLKNAPLGIYPELFLVDSEHNEVKSIQTP